MRPFNSEGKYLNNFKIFYILARLKLIQSFKFINFCRIFLFRYEVFHNIYHVTFEF